MKQEKKRIVTGSLLVLILAAGAGYLLQGGSEEPGKEEEWICTKGSEGIRSIRISSGQDQDVLDFTKEKSSWSGEDGSTYENDQFAPYTAVLGYMKASKKIDQIDTREQQYGLDAPFYTISIKYDDDEVLDLSLGDTVEGLGMYVSLEGQDSAYLIDTNRAGILTDMVSTLYDVGLSNVRFDEIRGINILTPTQVQISMNRSEAPRADGDFYWNLFKPVAWTADTQKVSDMISVVQEIGVMNRLDSQIPESECGLDKEESELPSIAFYDTYDSEMILYLGKQQGDFVYCKTNYLEGIYLIDQRILQLVNVNINDIIDTTLYHYEVPSVEKCTVEWMGETHELRAGWISDDGGKKKGQRFDLDGTSITGAKYNSCADWFTKTKVSKVSEQPDVSGGWLGSVTVKRISPPYEQILTFRAVQGDETLVQVDYGQPTAAYITKQEIENFISLLRQ